MRLRPTDEPAAMSDPYTPAQITAVATDAAFAGGFLSDLAGRAGTLVTASGEFVEQARTAWQGPRADNDLGIAEALHAALGAGFADALASLAALLDELFEAGAEYGRELATHVYWRDVHRSRDAAHVRGDWARCGCPVDDTSGDPGASDHVHGPLLREAQLMVDTYCGRWRDVLQRAAVLMPPLAETVAVVCGAPLAVGELSAPVLDRQALVAAILANRPSPDLSIEHYGLSIDDVAAYFADGGDSGALSAAELGAALAPLRDGQLAGVWGSLTPDQRCDVIAERPDVASRVLLLLTTGELWQLRTAVAHPVLTREFTDRFGIEVGTRVAAIDIGVAIGSTNQVYVVKMSDDTVLVGVGVEERFGLFAETAAPGDEARLGVGMRAFGEHVYQFDSEDDAAAAIDRLRDAADRGLGDFLVQMVVGSELERVIGDLGGTSLVSQASGSGAYVTAALTLKRLADAGIELDISAETYDRADYLAPGATEFVAVQGIVLGGTIRAELTQRRGPATSGAAPRAGLAADGAFIVDLRTETAVDGSQQSFVTVTVTGGAAAIAGAALSQAGGPLLDVVPVSVVDGSATMQRGEVSTIVLTLSVDPGTNPLDVARTVATLDYFDALGSEQLTAAEILVTRDESVREVSTMRIDGGVFELSARSTEMTRTNLSTIHKPPGGAPYSPTDIHRQIEELL